MRDLIFVPILKTKKQAEPVVIEKVKHLFNKNIMPYIEIKTDLDDRTVIKIQDMLEGTSHFEGFIRKKEESLEENVRLTNKIKGLPNVIPVLNLLGPEIRNEKSKVEAFVLEHLKGNLSAGIRIPQIPTDSSIMKVLLGNLNQESFLFIDIGDDPYDSNADYFMSLCSSVHECKIIVISNERPNSLTGDDFEDSDYNGILNTGVIESIKMGKFHGDGFASYCSAKNNMNEGGGASAVYAAFLIYDYKHNDFFSIRSDEKQQVAKAYSSLKSKVDRINKEKKLITTSTPVSLKDLEDLLEDSKKGNASRYYRLGMIHYIEEIYYNLFGVSNK